MSFHYYKLVFASVNILNSSDIFLYSHICQLKWMQRIVKIQLFILRQINNKSNFIIVSITGDCQNLLSPYINRYSEYMVCEFVTFIISMQKYEIFYKTLGQSINNISLINTKVYIHMHLCECYLSIFIIWSSFGNQLIYKQSYCCLHIQIITKSSGPEKYISHFGRF